MQCYCCKEFGHIAHNCSKKFCNYCKQIGHIIKECPTRTENQRAQAFHATILALAFALGSNIVCPLSTTASTSQHVLTPEMVQQMILSSFSAFGFQGQGKIVSSPWFVDSGASNRMTGSSNSLHNLQKYRGTQHIQIANESNLPITVIVDISPSFSHVSVSPRLSTSLISIGQLVDNDCNVHFSHDGCLV